MFLFLFGLLVASCKLKACEITDRPADLSPPGTGVVRRIAFQPPRTTVTNMNEWTDWSSAQKTHLRTVLPSLLRSTGDTWVFVDDVRDAQIVLRTFDSRSCSDHGAAVWLPSEPNSVYFDTDCFHGLEQLTYGVMHELGHLLDYQRNRDRLPLVAGIRHICRYAGDRTDCHDTLFGTAIMNGTMPAELDPQTREAVVNNPGYRQLDVQMFGGR